MEVGELEFWFGLEQPGVETCSEISIEQAGVQDFEAEESPEYLAGLSDIGLSYESRIHCLEGSLVAKHGGRKVGCCLLKSSAPPMIGTLRAEQPQWTRCLVLSSLAALWESETIRVGAHDWCKENFPLLRELGFSEPALTQSQWESSHHPSYMYWLDLAAYRRNQPDSGAQPLTRRGILASARLLFDVFGSTESWLVSFLENEVEGASFGVVERGEVVACSLVAMHRDVPQVWAIAVRREFRGRGLGKTVLSASLAQLKAMGWERAGANIRKTNAPSIGLFRKSGFQRAR